MKAPTVKRNSSLESALNQINKKGLGLTFIVNDETKLEGVITDGDIRRAILDGVSLDTEVLEVMNDEPIKIQSSWNEDRVERFIDSKEVRERIPKSKALIIPIVNDNNEIEGIKSIYREENGSLEIEGVPADASKPEDILVIGGAGYIGSVLVRMLLERDYNVKVMDSLMFSDRGLVDLKDRDGFSFYEGDITNIKDVVEGIKDVDAVVNLAAIVGDPASNLESRKTLETNLFATKTLGQVARYLGVSKFVYASTCSVYGFGEDKFSEDSNDLEPLSPYAQTKLESEDAVLNLEQEGFYPTVLRFATAHGLSERMRFDLVVNLLTGKAIQDNEITVYGEGKQKRPFVHIRDISRSIIKTLEAPPEKTSGEIFNVGSESQNLTIENMAEKIKEEVPDAELKFITEKEDGRSYICDFSKIEDALGFEAKYSIGDTIEEIKDEFKKGNIQNYEREKYSNYKQLESQKQ